MDRLCIQRGHERKRATRRSPFWCGASQKLRRCAFCVWPDRHRATQALTGTANPARGRGSALERHRCWHRTRDLFCKTEFRSGSNEPWIPSPLPALSPKPAAAWTASLLGSLVADWRITPVRGQMLLFHAAPGQVRHIVLQGEHYLVPRRDGRILAGSTLEYVGFDKSTTRRAYDELHAAAVAVIPALARCPVEQHWAGLRPGSAQGIPLIGMHPQRRGLFINAGHFRNGVVTGPASARLLADMIFDRVPCVDPAPYGLSTLYK